MIAAVVNAVAILIGAALGCLLGSRLKQRFSDTIMNALALCVCVIGLMSALKAEDMLMVIICVALGAVIGEAFNTENGIEKLGDKLKNKLAGGAGFTQGFVTASLVYCVGSLAIMGSIEAGINNDYTLIFSKSVLDGVGAIVFASAYGVGVALSAVPVLIYQGLITLFASSLSGVSTEAMMVGISAVGGVLVFGIGVKMLGVKSIRVGNMLPAVFLPLAYIPIAELLASLF